MGAGEGCQTRARGVAARVDRQIKVRDAEMGGKEHRGRRATRLPDCRSVGYVELLENVGIPAG
jgi:hypothetical protein